MFKRKTVIVLGAGAGVEIGMPIGSTLSTVIATKLNIKFGEFGTKMKSGSPEIVAALKRIAKDREEDFNDWRATGCTVASGISYTRSIDAYINTHKVNKKIAVCAKLAIVQTILEYESKCALAVKEGASREWRNRTEVMGSWLPDLLYVLQDGVVVGENLDELFSNVCIINFNYDRCIEQFFLHALRDLYQIDENEAARLVGGLKIYHPYGVVGTLPPLSGKRQVSFGVTDYGDIVGLADEIRTFNEQIEEGDELAAMREEIASSERILFLGFHYHQQNMDLLKTSAPARGGDVRVFGTAVGRSGSDVNIIDAQIRGMLHERGGSWHIHLGTSMDCKSLFKEYSTTFLHS
jgi:hypothetical protein